MDFENWLRIRIDASKYHDIMQAGVDRQNTPEEKQHFTPENMKILIQWLPPAVLIPAPTGSLVIQEAFFEKRIRLNNRLYYDFVVRNIDPIKFETEIKSNQLERIFLRFLPLDSIKEHIVLEIPGDKRAPFLPTGWDKSRAYGMDSVVYTIENDFDVISSVPHFSPGTAPPPDASADSIVSTDPSMMGMGMGGLGFGGAATEYQHLMGVQDWGTPINIALSPAKDAHRYTDMPPRFPQNGEISDNDAKFIEDHSLPQAGSAVSFKDKEFLLGGIPLSILPTMIAKESNTAIGTTNVIHGDTSVANNIGEHTETITFAFEFVGTEQINNELRRVISQFYRMPFIPVQVLAPAKKDKRGGSYLLHRGIHAVAQQAIQISTIPGSPDAISVILTCKRFDSSKYLPEYIGFRDAISWPIWHWHVNRGLREYRDPNFASAELRSYRRYRRIGCEINPIYGGLETEVSFWMPTLSEVEHIKQERMASELTYPLRDLRNLIFSDITSEGLDLDNESACLYKIKEGIFAKISAAGTDIDNISDQQIIRSIIPDGPTAFYALNQSGLSTIIMSQLRNNQDRVPFERSGNKTYALIPLDEAVIEMLAKSYYHQLKGDIGTAIDELTKMAADLIREPQEDYLQEPIIAAELDYVPFVIEDDVSVDGVSVTITNILAELPCSGSPVPMYQFMGRGPIRATISLTGEHESISSLMALKEEADNLAYASRSHELEDTWILFIYNDVLELCGLSNFMLAGASETTIEGDPDISAASLDLVAVNPVQRDIETLIPLNPVAYNKYEDGFGVAYKFTGNYGEGLTIKLSQQLRAMQTMDMIDLYPELDLPTIRELDSLLSDLGYSNTVYSLAHKYDYIVGREWVDPDFYTWAGLGLKNAGQSIPDDADKIVALATRQNTTEGITTIEGTSDEIIPSSLKYIEQSIKISAELQAAIDAYDPSAPEVAPIEALAKELGVQGKEIAVAGASMLGRTDFMTNLEVSTSIAQTIDYMHHKVLEHISRERAIDISGDGYAPNLMPAKDSPEAIRRLWLLVSRSGPVLQSVVDPEAYVGIIDNVIERSRIDDTWVDPTVPSVKDITGRPDVEPKIGKVLEVIDGDTVILEDGTKIRLDGIDSPEVTGKPSEGNKSGAQPGSAEATAYLQGMIPPGTEIQYYVYDTDYYGRTVAKIVDPQGRNVNEEMVKGGHAWWNQGFAPWYTEMGEFQEQAKEKKLGIWSYDTEPLPPWLWRQDKTVADPMAESIVYLPPIDAPSIGSIQDRLKSCLFDEKAYSSEGRLLEAFPTMTFILNDEGERLNSWKFVDQYYLFRGVSSFAYTKHRMEATATAYVELSNLYENLTNWSAVQALSYAPPVGVQYRGVAEQIRNTMRDGWKELNDLVWRNALNNIQDTFTGSIDRYYHSIQWNWYRKIFATVLQSGFRVHIRMGYGNCFKRLPIVMNGAIREVEYTESTVRLVCQDDGKELTTMLPAVPGSTTTGWGSTAEPRDIIASIIAARGGHWWFHRHDYRRVLDRFLTRNILKDQMDTTWLSTWWANMNPMSVQSPFGIVHFGDPATSQGNYWLFGECAQNIFGYNTIGNAEPALGKGPFGYEWLTFSQSKFKDGGDEVNISIELYDMTTWDIAQVCASVNPDFIAQVHPFDMRSTLFYGKPTWPIAFTYDKELYMRQLLITASVHEWLKTEAEQADAQDGTKPSALTNFLIDLIPSVLPFKFGRWLTETALDGPTKKEIEMIERTDRSDTNIQRKVSTFSHRLITQAKAAGVLPSIGDMSDNEIEKVKEMIICAETAKPYEPWSGTPVEIRKCFMQVHYAVSHVNLISSNLIATDEDVYTRCVAEYRGYNSLIKSAASLPGAMLDLVTNAASLNMGQTMPLNAETHVSIPVMADYRIVPEMQRTLTVDSRIYSTKVQGSFSRFQMGELPSSPNWISTCVALSALRDSVKLMYKGTITIRGNGCIKPYDLIAIMDIQSGITGPVTARSVTHIMDASGFTTSIEPDCLVSSIVDPEMSASCQAWSMAIGSIIWAYGFSKLSTNIASRALASALANIVDIYVKIAGKHITGLSFGLLGELAEDTPASTYAKVYQELKSPQTEAVVSNAVETAKKTKPSGFLGRTWSALKEFSIIKSNQVKKGLGLLVRDSIGVAGAIAQDDEVAKLVMADVMASQLSKGSSQLAIVEKELQVISKELSDIQMKGIYSAEMAEKYAELTRRYRRLDTFAKGLRQEARAAGKGIARASGKVVSRAALKGAVGLGGGPMGWIMLVAGLVLEPSFGDWVKVQANRLMFLQSLIITPLNRHGYEFSAGIKGHSGSVVTDPVPAWRKMLFGSDMTNNLRKTIDRIDWVIPIGSLTKESGGIGMLESVEGGSTSSDQLFDLLSQITEKNMHQKLARGGNPAENEVEEEALAQEVQLSLQEIIEQLEVEAAPLLGGNLGAMDAALRYAPPYLGKVDLDSILPVEKGKNSDGTPSATTDPDQTKTKTLPYNIEAAGAFAYISPEGPDGKRVKEIAITLPTGISTVENNALLLRGADGGEYRVQFYDQTKESFVSSIATSIGNIDTTSPTARKLKIVSAASAYAAGGPVAAAIDIGKNWLIGKGIDSINPPNQQQYTMSISDNGTIVELFVKVKANATDQGAYHRVMDGKIVAELIRRIIR